MLKNTSVKNIAVVLSAALLAAVAFSSGHFSNPDAHLRLTQAFSLVQGQGFAIGAGIGNEQHGNIATAPDGIRYSVYAPGQIVLFAPFAWIASKISVGYEAHAHYIAELLASFLGPFLHFITAFLVYFVARNLGREVREAGMLALIYAFGVMSLASSRDGYEHTYEAFFLLASMHSAWLSTGRRDGGRYVLAAGLILGVGALFRPNVLLAVPALLYVAKSPARVLQLVVGLAPAICCLLLYNYLRFGNPLDTGYPQAWSAANPGVTSGFDVSFQHLAMSVPGLLFSPGKGLFIFSPILLAVLFLGPDQSIKRKKIAIPIIYIAIVYIFFYSANFAWHGSFWSWGPRYLVPIIPFLILAIPVAGLSRKGRFSLLTLLAISFVIQALSVISNYQRHLISLWQQSPEVFANGDILTRMELSPLVGSLRSSVHVLTDLFSNQPLYTYFDPTGWHNEARPASLEMMLSSSIDLNSIDLWWVRLLYFPLSESQRICGFFIGFSATVLVFLLLGSLARRKCEAKE